MSDEGIALSEAVEAVLAGTALFYVLRVPEFTFPGLSHLIYENDFLVVAGTFTTVIFLVYFPLGILVPALRPWAAVMSIGFHLGIALLMGLTSFALTMVACDLVFLSRGLDEAVSMGSQLIDRMRSRSTKGSGTAVESYPAPALTHEKVEAR